MVTLEVPTGTAAVKAVISAPAVVTPVGSVTLNAAAAVPAGIATAAITVESVVTVVVEAANEPSVPPGVKVTVDAVDAVFGAV
jgi:hypothetical protein